MDIFNLEDFKSLASVSDKTCISIYLQMHDKGKETRQNAIRFKNALSETKEALGNQSYDASAVRDRLEPLGKLLDDGSFWRNQSQGLAIFVSSEISRVYRLPLDFEDLHILSGRFHLKPLLPLIGENIRFFILALAQNSSRLYRCDRLHIDPLTVENMPKGIDDALKYDLQQRQFQFYTGAPVARGPNRRAAVFHGQGVPADEQNDRLLRYCRQIDAAVFEVMRNETAPLILAGVDKLLAVYREASAYPSLKEEAIIGNPEHVNPAELHRQGWRAAAAELEEQKHKAIEKYNALKGIGRTSADLPSIVSCAFDGRVDRLIMGAGLRQWGRCDDNGRNVELLAEPARNSGALDLLDVAACETILNGGEVFTIDADRMPEKAFAVAALRF